MKRTGQRLWEKAKKLIPGGNQLLSKRAEMFLPGAWPAYFSKAKGPYIWDLDGNKYLDMSIMGIGACPLGYADPDVNKAVTAAVGRGSMATWNTPDEVELAELLTKIHPWADMVRYARTGGESMAIAARIARAHTGRDTVAFCGYHGWSDWYLATNLKDPKGLNEHLLAGLEPKGVPEGLRGSILPFRYNRIDELEALVKQTKGKLAAIIMEPIHGEEPKDNFLQKVRAIATQTGAVLVFDEISIGWKETVGGSHLMYKVNPDIAVFSKGMSNGYPMAAIIGKRKVMESAQDTFISSTYWTESIGPAAALATIKKIKRLNVPRHLIRIGTLANSGLKRLSKKHGINVQIGGTATMGFFSFEYGPLSNAVKTLFTQEMLKRGILAANRFYPSYAHSEKHIKHYLQVMDKVFALMKDAIDSGTVEKKLQGPVAHSGFQRLN
ncbi:MAG: aminotransferase class III-fold pyridoxal phosphate-dependent enzyme [Patescibacteria group bacterium]